MSTLETTSSRGPPRGRRGPHATLLTEILGRNVSLRRFVELQSQKSTRKTHSLRAEHISVTHGHQTDVVVFKSTKQD